MGVLYEILTGNPSPHPIDKPWWWPSDCDGSWPENDEPAVLLRFVRSSIESLRTATNPVFQVKPHEISAVRKAYHIVEHLVVVRHWPNAPAMIQRSFQFPQDCSDAISALAGVARWLNAGPEGTHNEVSKRLDICLDPPQAVLDGTPYAMSPDGATFVQKLVDAKGDWISGKSLDIGRPDRIYKAIPKPIQELIESATFKGYRIQLSRLA